MEKNGLINVNKRNPLLLIPLLVKRRLKIMRRNKMFLVNRGDKTILRTLDWKEAITVRDNLIKDGYIHAKIEKVYKSNNCIFGTGDYCQ